MGGRGCEGGGVAGRQRARQPTSGVGGQRRRGGGVGRRDAGKAGEGAGRRDVMNTVNRAGTGPQTPHYTKRCEDFGKKRKNTTY